MTKSDSGQDSKVLEAAWRLLAVRPRTKNELTDRLIKKGYSSNSVAKVLEYLTELGEIDDSAFARLWVAQRESSKPVGRVRLKQELLSKGVSREIIAAVLENYSDQKEYELAFPAGKKRYQFLLRTEAEVEKRFQKLRSWLQRRGFSSSVIRKVEEKLRVDEEDLDS